MFLAGESFLGSIWDDREVLFEIREDDSRAINGWAQVVRFSFYKQREGKGVQNKSLP